MKLKQYNRKRDFNSTDEPVGKVNYVSKNRFVIQHHFARKEHYDFRLEHNGVLLSFAVPKGLPEKPTERRLAVHVEDHPVDYINFYGEIPKGNYGAGVVEIFDKGTYTPTNDISDGIKKGHIKFELKGKCVKGAFSLVRSKEPNWLFIKHDEAKKQKNPFSKCNVKLAKLTGKIPNKNYIFEIKYDGYRIVAYLNQKAKLKSRNNNDYTSKFSGITKSIETLSRTMVLDGEVVAFDENGKSDFGLLNENLKQQKDNFCYVVFDILALDGKDLRDMPLLKRKKILHDTLSQTPKNIILSSFVEDGKKSFNVAKKLGLEGIVAKEINSTYNGERDNDWLKIKCYKRQEFVVGGYSKSESNKDLSAIYVGYYKKTGALVFAGKVGTGFTQKTRKELSATFSKITRKRCPFENLVDENAIWLKPSIVAEIQFAEFTKSNVLRQPSFVGLRFDKAAKEVKLEKEHE